MRKQILDKMGRATDNALVNTSEYYNGLNTNREIDDEEHKARMRTASLPQQPQNVRQDEARPDARPVLRPEYSLSTSQQVGMKSSFYIFYLLLFTFLK
jgi:hypothetical protein